MKLLFTGNGTSGSWQVRGIQLSQACGGVAKPNATARDVAKADLIVAVKRMRPELLRAIQKSGKPWAWDIVDAYPQPECSTWNKGEAIAWVQARLKAYKPTAVIWPNQRMRDDCDMGIDGIVLKHHFRPDIALNPIREQVKTVGYEGCHRYLTQWKRDIESECDKRGWEFRMNPATLSELDIVVSFRDKEHGGYVQHHWKSNVKLANAHGSGTPFVGSRECGYTETATGLEQWCDSPDDLHDCFDRLSEQYHRQTVRKAFLAKRYSVDDAARDLTGFLCGL